MMVVFRRDSLDPSRPDRAFEAEIAAVGDLEQYRHAHHPPKNYPVIRRQTPRSVWLSGDLGIDGIIEAPASFGDGPIVLKDFVRSRQHEWVEACLIPSASDRRAVEGVVARFLDLQGDDLNKGLVFLRSSISRSSRRSGTRSRTRSSRPGAPSRPAPARTATLADCGGLRVVPGERPRQEGV